MRRTVEPPAVGDAYLASPVALVASRGVLWADAETPVSAAARQMHDADVGSLVVRGLDGDGLGIITDRDLRRIVAEGLDLGTRIGQVASRPLLTLAADSTVADAHLAMLEAGVHHLALSDVQDGLVGMVSRSDLHRHQSRGPFFLLHRIDRAQDADTPEVLDYARQRLDAVRSLRQGGVAADRIGRMVSHLDDHLARRCLEAEIGQLELEAGTLPAPWAWVVFGSDGRREQPMLLDQHNALVFDPSRLDRGAIAHAGETFHRLASRVTARLRASGLPEAAGGFVAQRWCSTLAEWRRRFRHWLEEPDAESIEHAQVFFDLRRVTGNLDVGLSALGSTQEPPVDFLRLLTAMALRRRPAARRWRGLLKNSEGQMDLAQGGMRPLVALARVAGLAVAFVEQEPDPSASTASRLAAAARHGLLPHEDAERLGEIFHSLADRILDLQLASAADGRVAAACLRPMDLARHVRHRLTSELLFVRRQQAGLDAAVRRFVRAAGRSA